jgi:small subunit ribosomal protein S17
MQREEKKKISGVVTKINSAKTITVLLERMVKHPKYGKYMRKTATYKVHDEKNEAHRGDEVEIAEARPLSKTKKWRLVTITKKAPTEEATA